MFTLPNFSKDIPFQQHTVLRLGIPRQLLLLNVRAAAWKLRTRVPVLLRAGKTRGQRRAIVPSPSLPRSPQELPRPGRAPSSPPPPSPAEAAGSAHLSANRQNVPLSPCRGRTAPCPDPHPHPLRSPPRPRAGAGRAPAHLSPRPAAGRGAGPAEQVGAGGRWRWRGLPLREGRRGGGGVVRL